MGRVRCHQQSQHFLAEFITKKHHQHGTRKAAPGAHSTHHRLSPPFQDARHPSPQTHLNQDAPLTHDRLPRHLQARLTTPPPTLRTHRHQPTARHLSPLYAALSPNAPAHIVPLKHHITLPSAIRSISRRPPHRGMGTRTLHPRRRLPPPSGHPHALF